MAASSAEGLVQVCAAVALLTVAAASCRATDIAIRVINAENGEPMEKQEIWLFLGKDTSAPERKGVTDQGGRVVFHISGSLPERFLAYEASYMRGLCSDIHFVTSEVLDRGVVPKNHCDEKHRIREPIRPRPGEAVIFQRRPHKWEYLQ